MSSTNLPGDLRSLSAQLRRDSLPGFAPCEKDRQRNAKYDARAAVESEVYAALRDGRKLYDPGIRP